MACMVLHIKDGQMDVIKHAQFRQLYADDFSNDWQTHIKYITEQ